LCGVLATLSNYKLREFDFEGAELIMSAMIASMTTRQSSLYAFKTKRHAFVTPDILDPNTGLTKVILEASELLSQTQP